MPDLLFADPDLAALYDPMCPRQERDDFDFYLPLIMAARAVLDVGCGTGSLLAEARAAGHTRRLCGLDPACGMLGQAQKHTGIEWVLGDLRSTGWQAEFDLVVMTGHAFQVLVDNAEIRAALIAIRKALKPGGRFAFETRNPEAKEWERWTTDRPVEIASAGGLSAQMTRHVTVPFDGRTVTFVHTFSGAGFGKPQICRSTLRFLSVAELTAFLDEAGFVIDHQFGDWDRSPVTLASPEIITIARAG